VALTLEEAIARVPQWAGASDLKSTPLGGGITNRNFRIDVGGESFVLRIAGEDTELLGINREYEYQANLSAGRLGIAPEVYYFIQPEGYLVTRFINGRAIPPEEISQPENILRVAGMIQKIHSMPTIPGRFDVFQVVRDYSSVARRYQVEFPKEYEWLTRQVQEAEHALNAHPAAPVACHNDLLNANFLAGSQLYLLDWEYAGMGDRYFDLANFSAHHELTSQQEGWLLQCYYGRESSPSEWTHLQIMKVLSDLREACWGFVQIGISKLDFDFHTYADMFFSRALNNIHQSNWNKYLKEVIDHG
jgi:thiamine kinase-like enzyme